MLFDLRSRGRRRTVQVIYIGLAVLIGAGLVLFGVGTGSGGGGLFGGLSGNGSASSSGAINGATKSAIAKTRRTPDSAGAWAALINARFSAANATYDSTTNAYTTAGKQQLTLLLQAWGHYQKLTKAPSAGTVGIAAKAYSQLGQYTTSADLYQTVSGAQSNLHDLECITLESYAAGNERVAQLAEARVLSKLPKSARATTKADLEAPKTTPSKAAETC